MRDLQQALVEAFDADSSSIHRVISVIRRTVLGRSTAYRFAAQGRLNCR